MVIRIFNHYVSRVGFLLLLLELLVLWSAATISALIWIAHGSGDSYLPALAFAPLQVLSMSALGMYHPHVILAGRRINDGMAKFVAEKTVKEMVRAGFKLKGSCVTVLGLTFKENCPDLRNSKVCDMIHELESYGLQVHVHDPVADADEAFDEYGIRLAAWEQLPRAEAIISAVAHRALIARPLAQYREKIIDGGCFIDIKSQFDPAPLRAAGLHVWRL